MIVLVWIALIELLVTHRQSVIILVLYADILNVLQKLVEILGCVILFTPFLGLVYHERQCPTIEHLVNVERVVLLLEDRVGVRDLDFEEFEDLQPYHLDSVRCGLEILKVVTQCLDDGVVLCRALLVRFGDAGHYKCMLLLISSRIKAHLGGNV